MTKAMATYIDQSHTATNATGDIVAATCVSVTEGTLDCTAPACIDEVKKQRCRFGLFVSCEADCFII